MNNSFIYTGSELSIVLAGVPHTIAATHPQFVTILDCIKQNRWEAIPALINVAKAVQAFGHGQVVVDEDAGVIRYNGEVLHNSLTDRIIQMMNEGFTITPFIKFIENLMSNPSKRAVDELYTFLEYGKLPITEDGHFLAYKRVRANYTDSHSGTIDNSVGQVVKMDRNRVDDRSDITCSTGLHFCSLEYLKDFDGAHVMIIKINPRDVVSIPTDYNNTKGRCCGYEVVREYEGAITDPAFHKSVHMSDGSEAEPNEDDDEDEPRGYDEGHNTGIDDFNNGQLSTYDEGDLRRAKQNEFGDTHYIEGYINGFNETETADRRNADLDDRDDPEMHSEVHGVTDDEVSTDYVDGYVKGHKEGRKDTMPEVESDDLAAGGMWEGADYGRGYVDGYKDGRSHRARKHTKN